MNTKHTPGPWTTPGTDGDARVVSGRNRRHGGRRQTIAHVYSFALHGRTDYETERDANATLIAAAPDLLAACRDTLRTGGDIERSLLKGGDKEALRSLLAAVREAVKKAEAGE